MDKNFLDDRPGNWMNAQHKRMSSSAMILENEKGEALIVKAHYKNYWAFPGGIIDPGETPKEAAIRETYEEVGIKINPKNVEFVGVITRTSPIAITYQFVFKAPLRGETTTHINLEKSEISDYAFVSYDEVKENERHYGKILLFWSDKKTGYIEQVFGLEDF